MGGKKKVQGASDEGLLDDRFGIMPEPIQYVALIAPSVGRLRLTLIQEHQLLFGNGRHDVLQQRPGPGKVPKIAEGLPDETVTEKLTALIDEAIVGRDGCVVILVASVDGPYRAGQISDLSRLHTLGLFALNLWVDDAGQEVVAVRRQVACVLIDACVVAAESEHLAVVAIVADDYLSHLEHTVWERAVQQRDDVPVGGYVEDGNNEQRDV